MSDLQMILLLILGSLIIAGLAFYAGRLLYLLKRQQQKEQAFMIELERKQKAKNAHLIMSVQTIAKAIKEEQCELSEGAIRICTMLNNFAGQDDAYAIDYPAFYQLFNGIKDFPTHQAYLDLTSKERGKQDMKRWNLEADVKDKMLVEAATLASFQSNLH